jgi:hypothetical protein
VFYQCSITIPAATVKDTPEQVYLTVSKGTIQRWFVGFPPGCAALAHIAVYWHEQKVFPAGEEEAVNWDDYVFDPLEDLDLSEPPYRLKVVGWNDDTSYEHTIQVAVVVFPTPDVTTEGLLERMLHAFVGG